MKVTLINKLNAYLVLIFTILTVSPAYAVPTEIILIRHAEKLNQYQPGPFLSRVGQERANEFMRYYLHKMEPQSTPEDPNPMQTFPIPNFIITTKPTNTSNREQLTIAPLASALISQGYFQPYNLILDTYSHGHDGLKALTKSLLTDTKFKNQVILICWHHGEIPKLLDLLGVTPHQNKLADDEYDTVYDVKFNSNGTSILTVLSNQYPIPEYVLTIN